MIEKELSIHKFLYHRVWLSDIEDKPWGIMQNRKHRSILLFYLWLLLPKLANAYELIVKLE